ncbi:aldehyde dehydrogenase [uncultured Cloacibacillus sp.]|uniref:aldehyde dehydrogenase family protein n=1 Tax=uncultured Cloacibacillus sp. TaxID=889794 RepID=UPI0026DC2974|nr:aldehyde dehydrogenase family protein [uncultured Cloacibacillus sp.]
MKMIIGGKKIDSSDGRTMNVVNPYNQEIIDTVPMATKEDIDIALDNAVKGFEEWSLVPLWKRINIAYKFVDLWVKNAPELIDYLVRECGKPYKASKREVEFYTKEFFEEYIEAARFLGGESIPVGNRINTENHLITTVREPLGVFVSFLPFNYPASQVPHKAMAPLLMGNSVILKPSSETPLAQIRMVELFLEAGVPANAIQIVTGSGSKIGAWLSGDPRVAMVSLTGSTRVGIEIAKEAARHLAHTQLELGGNDPLVILPDCNLSYAVEESIAGRSLINAGQACCSTKRFLIPNTLKTEYLNKLIAAVKDKKLGDPASETTEVGPVISLAKAEEAVRNIQHVASQGASILLGGGRNGAFVDITVMDVPKTADSAKDLEMFAPVFTVIGYDTIDEAIEIANQTCYGLSSGVIGNNLQEMMYVAKRMQAGACVINGNGDMRTFSQQFGGYKMTGIGREGARITLEECTQVKTIAFKNMYK